MQRQRKQYGIQHNFSGTMHYSMSDTLPSVSTLLSIADNNYYMWGKVQVLVILARTKLDKDIIFFGNKEITLNALVRLLKNGHNGSNMLKRY